MPEVVYGQTKKKPIADKLVAVLDELNVDGALYIGYPVLASVDEPVTVDALGFFRTRVGFALEELTA